MTYPKETTRLSLEPLAPTHLAGMAAINADPVVMEYFPATQDTAQTAAFLDCTADHWQSHRFGWLALHEKDTGAFLGFTGLARPSFQGHLADEVEIGWRLAASAWGKGYASEAALACLAWAFDALKLEQVVSFTAGGNLRSQAVMRRIGMLRAPELDFDHPRLPPDSPLRAHVVYRITADRR